MLRKEYYKMMTELLRYVQAIGLHRTNYIVESRFCNMDNLDPIIYVFFIWLKIIFNSLHKHCHQLWTGHQMDNMGSMHWTVIKNKIILITQKILYLYFFKITFAKKIKLLHYANWILDCGIIAYFVGFLLSLVIFFLFFS